MRSRSPLWCIQRCRRTTATTKQKPSYSKPSLPSTFFKRLVASTSSVRLTVRPQESHHDTGNSTEGDNNTG